MELSGIAANVKGLPLADEINELSNLKQPGCGKAIL
jgi:hypothetical protein